MLTLEYYFKVSLPSEGYASVCTYKTINAVKLTNDSLNDLASQVIDLADAVNRNDKEKSEKSFARLMRFKCTFKGAVNLIACQSSVSFQQALIELLNALESPSSQEKQAVFDLFN